jgi:hypothetical protein
MRLSTFCGLHRDTEQVLYCTYVSWGRVTCFQPLGPDCRILSSHNHLCCCLPFHWLTDHVLKLAGNWKFETGPIISGYSPGNPDIEQHRILYLPRITGSLCTSHLSGSRGGYFKLEEDPTAICFGRLEFAYGHLKEQSHEILDLGFIIKQLPLGHCLQIT